MKAAMVAHLGVCAVSSRPGSRLPGICDGLGVVQPVLPLRESSQRYLRPSCKGQLLLLATRHLLASGLAVIAFAGFQRSVTERLVVFRFTDGPGLDVHDPLPPAFASPPSLVG